MIDDLEELANTFTDFDANWWPFVFLRPRNHTRFGTLRAGVLAALYGLLTGSAGNVIGAAAQEPLPFGSAMALPIIFTALFFTVIRFWLAWAWNRRVARTVRSLPAKQAQRQHEAHQRPESEDYDL